MEQDTERLEALKRALRDDRVDGLVTVLPENVLMLSGYWPVTATSIALMSADGKVALVVPDDERELASSGWADFVHTFQAASLEGLTTIGEAACRAVREAAAKLHLDHGSVLGYQRYGTFVPATYASMFLHGPAVRELLLSAVPSATLRPAGDLLAALRGALTTRELAKVRVACAAAKPAFEAAAASITAGVEEYAVALSMQTALCEGTGNERRGGYTFCMSGPNSAEAKAAYQLTRSRKLQNGDVVLVHCNSYVNGFWTDITRTFVLGEPDAQQRDVFRAVMEASHAGIDAVRPGANASDVDAAVRTVMKAHGFGSEFTHATGHGVGFAAIDRNALPRIHPQSPDVLQAGMVFNIEPAAYFQGQYGIRHCNMVAVTDTGAELLTPFLW